MLKWLEFKMAAIFVHKMVIPAGENHVYLSRHHIILWKYVYFWSLSTSKIQNRMVALNILAHTTCSSVFWVFCVGKGQEKWQKSLFAKL